MADDGITNLLIRRQDVDDFRLVNDFTAHTPIRRLKHVIEGICAIPTPHQRLLFRGRVLEDHQHLGDYGVESGSAIHLVVYPIAGVVGSRGGPRGPSSQARQRGVLHSPPVPTGNIPPSAPAAGGSGAADGQSRPTSLDIFSGLTSFFDSVEYGGSRMQDLPPLPLASAGDPWPAPTPRQLAAQEGEAGAMWQRHLLRGVRRALRNDRAHMTGLDRALRRALRRAGMPEVHDRGERGSWSDDDGSDGEDNEWESLGSEEECEGSACGDSGSEDSCSGPAPRGAAPRRRAPHAPLQALAGAALSALLRRYLGLFGTGTGPDNPSHGVMGRRLRSLARSLLHMHCCRRTPPPVLQADLQLLQQHLAVVGAAAAELMRVAQCYAAWLGQDNAWITRAEPGYVAVLGTDWQGHAVTNLPPPRRRPAGPELDGRRLRIPGPGVPNVYAAPAQHAQQAPAEGPPVAAGPSAGPGTSVPAVPPPAETGRQPSAAAPNPSDAAVRGPATAATAPAAPLSTSGAVPPPTGAAGSSQAGASPRPPKRSTDSEAGPSSGPAPATTEKGAAEATPAGAAPFAPAGPAPVGAGPAPGAQAAPKPRPPFKGLRPLPLRRQAGKGREGGGPSGEPAPAAPPNVPQAPAAGREAGPPQAAGSDAGVGQAAGPGAPCPQAQASQAGAPQAGAPRAGAPARGPGAVAGVPPALGNMLQSMLGSGAPSADGAGGGGGLGSLLSGMMNNPALMQMAESPAVQQMMGQILGDGAIEGGQQGHVLRGATLREAFSNLLGEVTAGGAPGRRQGSRGGRPEDDLDPSSAEALEAALATAPPELAQTWRGWITQDAAAVAAAGNLEALDQEYFRVMAPAARPSVFGSGSQ
ncbi:hypothetical protein ACKKBF_B37950 [Auxenochlorella protothecoides x Auxenochlorella symbiontica]